MTTTPTQAAPTTIPADVLRALDRMCTPLHESHLKGATAEADAHCMKIIRDYVVAASEARDVGEAEVQQRDRLLVALERAAIAESALRALADECDNDATPGWGDRMRACIDNANRLLATRASEAAPVVLEGCTPADAKMLRAANHGLADENAALREALQFYADGSHFVRLNDDAWDTCSGEPTNFLFDETETAQVEDGSVAKAVLAKHSFEPDAVEAAPVAVGDAKPLAWRYKYTWQPEKDWKVANQPPTEYEVDSDDYDIVPLYAALASQAAPNTATTVYDPEFVRNKFADYETQILNLREELAARVSVPDAQQANEHHGLDTPERVCFYEQDFYVLSNFSSFRVLWKDIDFDTSEAAYHWEKFPNAPGVQAAIHSAGSAHNAFKVAERFKASRRPDWDDVKVDIMRGILRAKAEQHEYVLRKLLATGHRELVENSWRDDFWGWGPNRDGQNMLGKLWMEVRAELRATDVAKGESA